MAFVQMARYSDDRVVAIVAAAYVDDCLTQLIVSALPGLNSSLRERLFRPEGALGQLAPKIDLAKALTLISGDERSDYITLVRVRNRMAHYVEATSFDFPEVTNLINAFKRKPNSPNYLNSDLAKNRVQRTKFEFVVIELLMELQNKVASIIYNDG